MTHQSAVTAEVTRTAAGESTEPEHRKPANRCPQNPRNPRKVLVCRGELGIYLFIPKRQIVFRHLYQAQKSRPFWSAA
jgi:hypothetical protein